MVSKPTYAETVATYGQHADAIERTFGELRRLLEVNRSRELSIALTHLDTARLWAREAFPPLPITGAASAGPVPDEMQTHRLVEDDEDDIAARTHHEPGAGGLQS